jgi:hypothetical protein
VHFPTASVSFKSRQAQNRVLRQAPSRSPQRFARTMIHGTKAFSGAGFALQINRARIGCQSLFVRKSALDGFRGPCLGWNGLTFVIGALSLEA